MQIWMIYALVAAVFASGTNVLAKAGLAGVGSNVATLVRAVVALLFTWIVVFSQGLHLQLGAVDSTTLLFLVLSGLSAGGSWLCFLYALKLGPVQYVMPLDKSSIVITMVLSAILFAEPLTVLSVLGIVAILSGTYLMINIPKDPDKRQTKDKKWIVYALLGAVFCSLTTIFGRMGIVGIHATLGVAIRTIVIIPMSLIMIKATKQSFAISDKKKWLYLVGSGLCTGFSWLFFYRALQVGHVLAVVSLDRLSIVLACLLAAVFFKERMTKKTVLGLAVLVTGTMLVVF